MIYLSGGFPHILDELREALSCAPIVRSKGWQGIENEVSMRELRNVVFEVDLRQSEDLDYYRSQINPNVKWADEHFDERVGGHPLNPAPSWTRWPYANSAAKFRDPNAEFEHTYCELFWPKYAGLGNGGKLNRKKMGDIRFYQKDVEPKKGTRTELGDLQDVIELLAKDPTTRQAYFPLFGPEFIGLNGGKRKPCSLGYNFLVRNNLLHCHYAMRSVDYIRHLNDDLYLAVRLMLFVLEVLRRGDSDYWDNIKMGTLSFQGMSVHCFESDKL